MISHVICCSAWVCIFRDPHSSAGKQAVFNFI